jgi:hypothetical protein
VDFLHIPLPIHILDSHEDGIQLAFSSFPLAPLKPPFLNSSLPHGIFEKHIMIIISRGEIRHPFRFSGQQRLTGKLIF